MNFENVAFALEIISYALLFYIVFETYRKTRELEESFRDEREKQNLMNERIMFRLLKLEQKTEKMESQKYGKVIYTDEGEFK